VLQPRRQPSSNIFWFTKKRLSMEIFIAVRTSNLVLKIYQNIPMLYFGFHVKWQPMLSNFNNSVTSTEFYLILIIQHKTVSCRQAQDNRQTNDDVQLRFLTNYWRCITCSRSCI
jgi:hypothetical protein